jgi:hypothetical protein
VLTGVLIVGGKFLRFERWQLWLCSSPSRPSAQLIKCRLRWDRWATYHVFTVGGNFLAWLRKAGSEGGTTWASIRAGIPLKVGNMDASELAKRLPEHGAKSPADAVALRTPYCASRARRELISGRHGGDRRTLRHRFPH